MGRSYIRPDRVTGWGRGGLSGLDEATPARRRSIRPVTLVRGQGMASDNQLLKAAACCTNILRRYGERAPTSASRDLMVAEVEVLAGWLLELELPPGAVEDRFLPPVEYYLVACHGLEGGRLLRDEVIAVLERVGVTSPDHQLVMPRQAR